MASDDNGSGSTWVLVKFRKRKQAVETDATGSGLFAAVAGEFGVPEDRAKLVFRGRTFTQSRAAEIVELAQKNQKAVFVLLAARAEEQLDHGHSAVRRAGDAFYWEWGGRQLEFAWSGVLVCFRLCASVFRLFFSSLFTPSRRGSPRGGSGGSSQGGGAAGAAGGLGGRREQGQGLRQRHQQRQRGEQEGVETEDLSNTAARENGGTIMSWIASLRRW